MIRVNEHFMGLGRNYLFADIAKRVSAFKAANPQARVISLGIGDVTQPLCTAVIEAMHKAVDEMGCGKTFRGYGPEQGYEFLRQAIVDNDYAPRGVKMDADEVFVNDGAKSDTGNFQELLSMGNTICVADPIYPVYIDSNVMGGRAGELTEGKWSKVVYVPSNADNNFMPLPPQQQVDIIYLCYPNNPTGAMATREALEKWVEYALANHALILYDSAYEAYIRDPEIPHSIYEIEGARQCAVEFRSYSKTAGFTGVRCGYTIVPKELKVWNAAGEEVELRPLWHRRQCTKFNGTSYISQRAAEAIYSPEGKKQVKETIDYYMTNAQIMKETLKEMGVEVYGGDNAPYLWVRTPEGLGSWGYFDKLLKESHVVCTPGVGFGPNGEGYVRFTAFGRREDCIEAMQRIKK